MSLTDFCLFKENAHLRIIYIECFFFYKCVDFCNHTDDFVILKTDKIY